MKKRFLSLLTAIAGIVATASATLTIPWQDHFDATPTLNSEDGYYKECSDGYSTSASWYWQYFSGQLRVRGSTNGMNRTLITPQLDFSEGDCYYIEFTVPTNAISLDMRWEIQQLSGTSLSTKVADIATFALAAKETGTYGAYFVAVPGVKRIALQAIVEGYAGSYVYLDDLKVEKADVALPDKVTDLTASVSSPGLKSATISFKAPTTTVAGTALSDLSAINIYADGTLLKTIGNITPGQSITEDIGVSVCRTVAISVVPVNSKGEGAKASMRVEIGGTMGDVQTGYTYGSISAHHKALAVWSPEAVSLTWDEQSGAESYSVISMPSGETIAEGLTECRFTDTTPFPAAPSARWYQVKYVNAAGTAYDHARSNIVSINNTLPFIYSATSNADVNQLTCYTLSETYTSSFWQMNLMSVAALGVSATDHMAIMPGIKLEAGKHYRLDVDAMVSSSPVNMCATLGTANTAESQTKEIIPETLVKNTAKDTPQGLRQSGYFTVEADGIYFPAVRLYTSATSGTYSHIPLMQVVEVGNDLPGEIDDYAIAFDPTDPTKATITVTAPSKNIAGESLESIEKLIVLKDRLPYREFESVAPGDKVNFEAEVSATEQFTYNVYATNASGEGVGTDINLIIITPPYTQAFTDTKSIAGYTIINDDPMSFYTWSIQNSTARCYPDGGKLDDWLITPPLHLEAGKYYKTNFTTWGASNYFTNNISLWLGSEPTTDGMSTRVTETFNIKGQDRNGAALVKDYFTVAETGEYYLGFHAEAETQGAELYVDDFAISAAIDPRVPGASPDLTITPDKMGALRGNVEFSVPSLQLNGETLTAAPSNIYIYIDGHLFQDLGPNDPGQHLTVPVAVEEQGVHLITLICINSYGVGREAEGIAYFGINRPAAVKSTLAYETDSYGEVTVEWEKPTTDYDGFPINQDLITYEVFRYDPEEGTETQVASGLTGTSLTWRAQAADAQQDFMRFGVRARTDFGGSPGFLTNYVSVGKPDVAPFAESFAGGSPSMRFMALTMGDGTPAAWGYSPYLDSGDFIEPVDDDGGLAIMEVMFRDGGARLISGKIDLRELTHPGISLWMYNSANDPAEALNELAIEACPIGGEWQTMRVATVADYTAATHGWVKLQADLSPVAGQIIQLGLNATARSHVYTIIDNIRIEEFATDNLIMLALEAPEEVAPGIPFALTATTLNIGSNYAEDYDVDLYRDGELIATKECGALGLTTKGRARFTDTLSAHQAGSHTYEARIRYSADGDVSDDSRSFLLTAKENKFAGVENLTAIQSAPGEITLSWNAPELPTEPETIEEDFESFAPWTNMNDEMGDWTMYDVDGGALNGIIRNGESLLPAKVAPYTQQAFFVFDSTIPVFIDNKYYEPHSGGQCLMALANYPQSDPTSDWLVSPVLSGKAQTISFYAKSISNDSPESFKVHINTDMTRTVPSTFTLLESREKISDEWTKYEFALPEGTQHFAIEHCSAGGFVFMLDDIVYTAGGDERLTPKGFNIYHEGEVLAKGLTDTSYIHRAAEDGEHNFGVSAMYDLGESPLAQVSLLSSGVSGIYDGALRAWGGNRVINISGDYTRLDLYALDGAHLYTLTGEKSIPAAAGVYLVNIDGTVFKVTVK